MNDTLLNISSSPHIRKRLTVGNVMLQVILALIPSAVFGIYRYGLQAFLIIALAVLSSELAEFLFDYIAKKTNTLKDGSAAVTGLLLALSLSHSVPLYIPILGGIFAILFVKCFFGGLGKNFMNPALAARCFLLISFGGAMTNFAVDGVSSATPLAALQAGEAASFSDVFLGFSNGVIGGSPLLLIIGGLILLTAGGITIEIPASCLITFTAFMVLFGGKGLDPRFLLIHICSGGVLMGAFFMATDPVTSPMTSAGQLIYGGIIGILFGLFRVKGTATDSCSYAIIIANLLVPLIDKMKVRKPLGYKNGEYREHEFPKAAFNLMVVTLIAGLALSSIYLLTKDAIQQQKQAAKAASYQAVCPGAADFSSNTTMDNAIQALNGGIYDENFGKTYVNEAVVGTASDGSVAGYVISVTSADGFDGSITLSVGLAPDGTVNSISFTELNETAGMGMRCGDDEFKNQFNGVKTNAFLLNKTGSSTSDSEIDSVSGASISSGAVVNAVNTALAFFAETVG